MDESFTEITGRVKLPKGAKLRHDTVIYLMMEVKPSTQLLELQTTIEPSICFEKSNKDGHLLSMVTFEMDGILHWEDLPSIAEDKDKWERVRRLLLTGNYGLQEAYITVAGDTCARRWKFEMYFDSGGTELHLIADKKRPSEIIVAKCSHRVEEFFHLDESLLGREEASEAD